MVKNLAHSEPARGRDEDNKKYCSEDGYFTEFRVPCNPKRMDQESVVVEFLQEKGSVLTHLAKEMSVLFIRYGCGSLDFVPLAGISKEQDCKTYGLVTIGPLGVGKSCFVAEKCASSGWSVYYKPRGQCWD